MPSASPVYAFSSVFHEPETALGILDKELYMHLGHGTVEMSANTTTTTAAASDSDDGLKSINHNSSSSRSSSIKTCPSDNNIYIKSDQTILSDSESFFSLDSRIKTENDTDAFMADDSHLNNNSSSSSSSNNNISGSGSCCINSDSTNTFIPSFFTSEDLSDSITPPMPASTVAYSAAHMDCSTVSYNNYNHNHNTDHENHHNHSNHNQFADDYDPFKCLENIAEQSLTGKFTYTPCPAPVSSPFPSPSFITPSSSSASLLPPLSSSSSSSSPSPFAPSTSLSYSPSGPRGHSTAPSGPTETLSSDHTSLDLKPHHTTSESCSNGLPARFEPHMITCDSVDMSSTYPAISRDACPSFRSRCRELIFSSSYSSSISPRSSSSSSSSSTSSQPTSPPGCMYSNQHHLSTSNVSRSNSNNNNNSSNNSNNGAKYQLPSSQASLHKETIKVESPFTESSTDGQSYVALSHCSSGYTDRVGLHSAGVSGGRRDSAKASSGRSLCGQNSVLDMDDLDTQSLLSWTFHHPDHWSSSHLLDWLFYLAQDLGLDMGKFRSENFQNVTGRQLSRMSQEEVIALEPKFGQLIYQKFQQIRMGVIFNKPLNPGQLPAQSSMEDLITNNINNHNNNMNSSSHMSTQFCSSPAIPGQYSSCITTFTCPPPPLLPPAYQASGINHCGLSSDETFFKQDRCTTMTARETLDITTFDFNLSQDPCSNKPNCPDHAHTDYSGMYAAQYSPQATPIRTSQATPSRAPCCFPAPPYHSPQQQQQRRKPGRPKVKQLVVDEKRGRDKKAKNQHLWEFIHETLMNPLYNPQFLRWENQREGVFRFVQSEAVAQLWGGRKNNENMTYEKLSRAMRHYYKRGILERVEGRRLVYKFSIKAMDRAREKRHNSS